MSNGGLPPHADGSSQKSGEPIGGAQPIVNVEASAIESPAGSQNVIPVTPRERTVPNEQRTTEDQVGDMDRRFRAEHPVAGHADCAASTASGRGERDADKTSDTRTLTRDTGHAATNRTPTALVKQGLVDGVTFVAFLAAISLPFLYLPLLVFGGIDAARSTEFFLFLGLHVASLTIGYRYEPQKPFVGD